MTGRLTRSPRILLSLAAVAVAFAAADTYVVVLALPEMMGSTGIPVDQLQRAAPIISGFLLGYVAMLPLIGRIADLRGRVPVLVAALVVFAAGSLVTALAYDLPSMVAGRFLQGVGGGGLVPATLALVADLYPVERRGVPLGIVSAVQELGSVIGPLFGAVVLSVSDWRTIFLINLAVGLVLVAALRVLDSPETPPPRKRWRQLGRDRRSPPARHPGRRRPGLRAAQRAGHRPDLGRLLHPVHGREPVAHPHRRRGDRGVPAVPGALRHREAAAGRPAALGSQRAGGRPHRSPVPRDRAGRRDPGLRDGRPRGPGVLRPGAAGTSSARRSRPSPSSSTCVGPRRRCSPAARSGVRRPGAPSS